MRHLGPSFLRAIVVGAGAAAGGGAAAQGELPDTRPPVHEVVARLDDKLFAVRERAMSDLASRDGVTLEQIESLLAGASLSPEQRLRLSRIGMAIFMRGPRAAMGIRFANVEDAQPARIQEPQAGFDSMRVLRPGDQVLEADGIPVVQQATLRALILSHSPGDVMPLKIRRDGEEMQVELVLGSFAELEHAGTPRPVDLLEAWRMRRIRTSAGGAARTIEPGVQEGDGGAEGAPGPESPEWRGIFATGDAPDSLVLGGQARQGADLSLAELAAGDEARARASMDFGAGQGDLERQVVWFRQQRVIMAEDLGSLELRLARGDVNAIERQNLERDIASRRDAMRRINQQIEALEAAIRASVPRR